MPNTPDIDVSALAEALNEKMDRDLDNKAVNVHYIVETWHSDTEWYRVWSDGWIEQGGRKATSSNSSHAVTFYKQFSDTNYSVLVTGVNTNGEICRASLGGRTISGCSIDSNVGTTPKGPCEWYAYGF